MTVIADLLVKVGAEITGLQEGLATAETRLANFGANLTSAGVGMVELGAPLTALGALAAKTAGDFEASMNVLSVAARGSGTSLEDLRNVAIQAGSDVNLVGVGAADVAVAMTNFTKAGLDTSDMLGDMQGYLSGTAQLGGALRAAIDLAAASELDLEQASRLVTTTMSTFGLSADEVVGAMNNYVQSADASVASVGDLAAAMENIGPTMAAFGFTLEDVNTALAILSTRGISGAEAGTALKAMFTNMMRDTPDVKKALDELNISLYDQNGAMRSLPDIIGQFSTALQGMTEEQKNSYVQTIAGTYGMKAMNTLLAEGTTGWNNMETAIGSAATMQENAAARTQGFNASMEQLKSTVETFLINVGTPLIQDVLTPLVQKLTDVTGVLADVNPQFMEFVVVAGGIVTALGGAMVIVGQVAGAFSGLAALFGAGGAMAAVGEVILALAGPIGIVAAVVAALALAWNNNWFGIRDTLTAVWENNLRPAFETIRDWLEVNVPNAIRAVSNWWTGTLVPALREVWNFIDTYLMPLFRSLADFLGAVVGVAVTVLAGLWQNVMLPSIRAIWTFIDTWLVPIFEALAKVLGPVLQPVLDVIKTLFEKLHEAVSGIPTVLSNVTTWFGNLADKLRTLKLPDWLTPGSPTPLEIALLGILSAIKLVAGGPWGWIDPLLKLFGGGGAGGGVTTNINVTVAKDAVNVTGADPTLIGKQVGDAIAAALKALVKSEQTYGPGGGWGLPT